MKIKFCANPECICHVDVPISVFDLKTLRLVVGNETKIFQREDYVVPGVGYQSFCKACIFAMKFHKRSQALNN